MRYRQKICLPSAWAGLFLLFLFAQTTVTQTEADTGPALKKGVFLVATEDMSSPIFKKSVILIINHNKKKGSLGLIINRPAGHKATEILPHLKGVEALDEELFIGGPVDIRVPSLLINTTDPPERADKIFGTIYFDFDTRAASRKANEEKHDNVRAYTGFSSWAPGQLEAEIMRGGWQITHPDAGTIFSDEPDKIWDHL